jgi:hypothetical protein
MAAAARAIAPARPGEKAMASMKFRIEGMITVITAALVLAAYGHALSALL